MIQRKIHKTGLWATTILFVLIIGSYYTLYQIHEFRQRYVIECYLIPEDAYFDPNEYKIINLIVDKSKRFWWEYTNIDNGRNINRISEGSTLINKNFLKKQNRELKSFLNRELEKNNKILINLKIHRQAEVRQFVDILDEINLINKSIQNRIQSETSSGIVGALVDKYIIYRVLDYESQYDSLVQSIK